jgi:hypothetical protein
VHQALVEVECSELHLQLTPRLGARTLGALLLKSAPILY